MNVAAGPKLAAAVTNAGGIGVIGGLGYSPDMLREQVNSPHYTSPALQLLIYLLSSRSPSSSLTSMIRTPPSVSTSSSLNSVPARVQPTTTTPRASSANSSTSSLNPVRSCSCLPSAFHPNPSSTASTRPESYT